MALTTQDRMLIEQRVTNDAKSAGVAYLLWFFTGGLGGHRFYLGKTGTAIFQLVLFVVGWATVAVFVGFLVLAILGIWVLIDAFLIPGMIQGHKDAIRNRLTSEAAMYSSMGTPAPAEPTL
ncbi:TM2 domain-containing protein [uncultured Pelagibacterium sp.]|uniref:TM2 domain-containing protein n=1 Tax=uncultured Pelagibacterium sp. TaxID=1159875 RepID=UPI0030DC08F9